MRESQSYYDVHFYNQKFRIPERIYGKVIPFSRSRLTRLCLESRHSDGYVREAAVKALIACSPSPIQAAYLVVALCDYVMAIAILPAQSGEDVKNLMRKVVSENEKVVTLVQARIIGYWNEYYRTDYPTHNDYPPYLFLQSLN